jgi:hypothetical protein
VFGDLIKSIRHLLSGAKREPSLKDSKTFMMKMQKPAKVWTWLAGSNPNRSRKSGIEVPRWTSRIGKFQHASCEPSALEGWALEVVHCDLKGSRAFLKIISTEGRGVRPCWEYRTPTGPIYPSSCWLRGTLLIKNNALLGPYSKTISGPMVGPRGGVAFL